MSTKKKAPKKILVQQGDSVVEVETEKVIKQLTKECKIKPLKNEETGMSYDADQTMQMIVQHVVNGDELPDGYETYQKAYDRVKEVFAESEKLGTSAKEAAEAAKEAEKQRKEAEKAAAEQAAKDLAEKQGNFITTVATGAEQAKDQFIDEVHGMKDAMPEGISIVSSKGGYGINISEDATDASIGQALGYFHAKQANSDFLRNQIGFFIGDLANACCDRGLYKSGIEAGKQISAKLEQQGIRLAPRNVENYARMSRRIGIEYRNPKVDQTAYLEVSNAREPKKNEGESDKSFETRKANFNESRTAIMEKLHSGEIVRRQDVLKPVAELQYDHCGKERPSEEPQMTTKDYLLQYFHACCGLECFMGLHREDVAIYSCKGKSYDLTKEDLEELKKDAETNLINLIYSDKARDLSGADFVKGKAVTIETEGTGKNKKDVKKERPVYPTAFWDIPETPSTEGASAADSKSTGQPADGSEIPEVEAPANA